MVKKTAMIALAAAFATLPGPILADVDRFGEARMAAIEVVFERALQNPEADVDRLSPARWSSVLEVYESHPPSILVDELPIPGGLPCRRPMTRWTAVSKRSPWRTDGPVLPSTAQVAGMSPTGFLPAAADCPRHAGRQKSDRIFLVKVSLT